MSVPNSWAIFGEGLAKHILKEGEGERPKEGQAVEVHYRSRRKDYSVKEEHWNQKDGDVFEIVLGQPCDPKELKELVEGMKKGEHAVYKIEHSLLRDNSTQPLDTEIAFIELELLGIFDKEPTSLDLPWEERGPKAEALKNEGNELLRSGELEAAMKKYELAYELIDWIKEGHYVKLKIAIRNNQCLVLLKRGNWNDLIALCNKTLNLDSTNTKAILRKAKALRELRRLEEARSAIEELKKLLPGD